MKKKTIGKAKCPFCKEETYIQYKRVTHCKLPCKSLFYMYEVGIYRVRNPEFTLMYGCRYESLVTNELKIL